MRLLLFILLAQDAPFPFTDVSADLDLPKGNPAWVLEVITRGGLNGLGSGDIRVSSDGKLNHNFRGRESAGGVKKENLRIFSEFIPPTLKVDWGKSSLGTCMDCIATLLRLKIRDKDGAVRTLIEYWDPTTQRRVPDEIIRLYDQARALSK